MTARLLIRLRSKAIEELPIGWCISVVNVN